MCVGAAHDQTVCNVFSLVLGDFCGIDLHACKVLIIAYSIFPSPNTLSEIDLVTVGPITYAIKSSSGLTVHEYSPSSFFSTCDIVMLLTNFNLLPDSVILANENGD